QIHSETSAGKFVDELVTWRELGQNMAHYAYRAGIPLGSLQLVPNWAVETLRKFTPARGNQVDLQKLEAAQSPDPVWNAAQRELLRTGVIHNYMRMLWGKGIVRWSNGPEEALQRMEYLNNKYSLDGRDPNSYTGIYWCLGKYDRPWPPAREPFGLVRSMSTASAQKKLRMQSWLANLSKQNC
ncbi:deoxyribodipyrimidine photolyase, partial [bacterium]|nr:deoxyribodipyrimidine photolyase [bacterium]